MVSKQNRSDVICGRFQKLETTLQFPSSHSHHVRLYVASAGQDSTVERSLLAERVAPQMRAYCRERGLDFQLVDLRWGVPEGDFCDVVNAELSHNEFLHCQKLSIGPCYLLLLTDRLGDRSLPNRLPLPVFDHACAALFRRRMDPNRLMLWYKLNENVSPPEYVLKREELARNAANIDGRQTRELRWLFSKAVMLGYKERRVGDQAVKLLSSGLEWVTYADILSEEAERRRALCVVRDLAGINLADQACIEYIQVDEVSVEEKVCADPEARDILRHLKEDILSEEGDILIDSPYHFEVPWSSRGLDPTGKAHADYLERMMSGVTQECRRCVSLALKGRSRTGPFDWLLEEVLHHVVYCQQVRHCLHVRDDIVERALLYITNGAHVVVNPDDERAASAGGRASVASAIAAGRCQPFIVYGPPGSGKTLVLGRVATTTASRMGDDCVVVTRFIGTSARSQRLEDVLRTLTLQICEAFQLHHPVGSHSYGPAAMGYSFLKLLERVGRKQKQQQQEQEEQQQHSSQRLARKAKTLVLIIDAMDLLHQDLEDMDLAWLPRPLPANVKVILSSRLERPVLERHLQGCVSRDNMVLVDALGMKVADDILNAWLHVEGRRLSRQQKDFVQSLLQRCTHPLYLRLLFREARQWESYWTPKKWPSFGSTVLEAIRFYFERLEEKHGSPLVQRSIGYLLAAREGLTENELLDVLSCDDDVMASIYSSWPLPSENFLRLPLAMWGRLRLDLEEHLMTCVSGGQLVLKVKQSIVQDEATRCYLTKETRCRLHSQLADYFLGRWHGTPKVLLIGERKLFLDRKVPSQPLLFGSRASLSTAVNHRKLTELPFHLWAAGRWSDLLNECLGNYEWVATVARTRSIDDVLRDISMATDGSDEEFGDVDEGDGLRRADVNNRRESEGRELNIKQPLSVPGRESRGERDNVGEGDSGKQGKEKFNVQVSQANDGARQGTANRQIPEVNQGKFIEQGSRLQKNGQTDISKQSNHEVQGAMGTDMGHSSLDDGQRSIQDLIDVNKTQLKPEQTITYNPKRNMVTVGLGTGADDGELRYSASVADPKPKAGRLVEVAEWGSTVSEGREWQVGLGEQQLQQGGRDKELPGSGRRHTTVGFLSRPSSTGNRPPSGPVLRGTKGPIGGRRKTVDLGRLGVKPDGRLDGFKVKKQLYGTFGWQHATVGLGARNVIKDGKPDEGSQLTLQAIRVEERTTVLQNSSWTTPGFARALPTSTSPRSERVRQLYELELVKEAFELVQLSSTSGRPYNPLAVDIIGRLLSLADRYPDVIGRLVRGAQQYCARPLHSLLVPLRPCFPSPWGVKVERLIGHEGGATHLDLSPDGALLASGGTDGVVTVYDVEKRRITRSLQLTEEIRHVCLLPDRKRLVTLAGRSLHFLALDTGQLLHVMGLPEVAERTGSTHNGDVISDRDRASTSPPLTTSLPRDAMSRSASGDWMTLISGRLVLVLDLNRMVLVQQLEGHEGHVTCLAMSEEGQHVVTGSEDKTVRVWFSELGQELHLFRDHQSTVTDVCVASERRAVSVSLDGTVLIFHVATGNCLHKFCWRRHELHSVSVDAGGTRVAVGSFGEIGIWDFQTGVLLSTVAGHRQNITRIQYVAAVAPTSSRGEQKQGQRPKAEQLTALKLMSMSTDGELKIWNVEDDQLSHCASGAVGSNAQVKVAASKAVMASRDSPFLKVWSLNFDPEKTTAPLEGGIYDPIAISADGKYVITVHSNGTDLLLHDVSRGVELDKVAAHEERITCLTMLSDSIHALSGSIDGVVKMWLLSGERLQEVHAIHFERSIVCLAAHPSSKMVIVCHKENVLRLRHMNNKDTDEAYIDVQDSKLTQVVMGEDQIIYGTDIGKIYVWSYEQLDDPVRMLESHTRSVCHLAVREKYLASVGEGEQYVVIWNCSTGKRLGQMLTAPDETATALAWSSDMHHLIIGSDMCTVHIYDIIAQAKLTSLNVYSQVSAIVANADIISISTTRGYFGVYRLVVSDNFDPSIYSDSLESRYSVASLQASRVALEASGNRRKSSTCALL